MNLWMILMIIAIIFFMVVPSFNDRVIPVRKLIIIPLIFMYLLCNNVTKNFSPNPENSLFLLLGIMAGISIGILMRCKTVVKSDLNRQLIWLPGTYSTLIIFLLIFAVHFVIGYLQSVHPEIFKHANSIEQVLLFMLACTSSLTVGTSACLYYKYHNTPLRII